MDILYTLGYSGLTPEAILRAAVRLNAIVADIRISPRSRHPMWNGPKMQAAWGDRYMHIPELGNLNYKGKRGEDVILADAEAGCARVLELLTRHSVILLCACSDWRTCHRRDAAALIAQRSNAEPIHLSSSEVRRFADSDGELQPPLL